MKSGYSDKLNTTFSPRTDTERRIPVTEKPGTFCFKILVIDDDERIRNLLEQVFSDNCYSVDIASNGSEGLNKICLNNYDIILSDIDMPLMSGIEMYIRLKEKFLFNNRIVFMSGSTAHQGFIEDNGLKFIEKPFSIKDVLEKIEMHVIF